MKIEAIRLKNFKAFKDVELKDIPDFCVIVGANGSGKSTIFQVFEFLRDALRDDVTTALAKLGGSRGLQEVRSRGSEEPIEIELKLSGHPDASTIVYALKIDEEDGAAFIRWEYIGYGKEGNDFFEVLNFSNGKGEVYVKRLDGDQAEEEIRDKHTLRSNDTLAIKGLSELKKYPVVEALGDFLRNWHLSDFHINSARPEQMAGYAEHLSREGENLSLVIEYLHKRHPEVFDTILEKMTNRVPGISEVTSKTTEEGRVLLKFQDGSFEDPFLARYVSDGTIKMLAYLTLLHDPHPHPLLCVEEPENQLYPKLLWELAEEFRDYSNRGGQVFVSTHSPDFLNATELEEVFWLEKVNGFTEVRRAKEDPQIAAYMNDGDKMGYLWKQGFFGEVDPQ